MAEQEHIIQESEKELLQVTYEYIEIEFILQDIKEKIKPKQERKTKIYEMGPNVSRKERIKDRRSRQKSWIEFNRNESEYSITEWRTPR